MFSGLESDSQSSCVIITRELLFWQACFQLGHLQEEESCLISCINCGMCSACVCFCVCGYVCVCISSSVGLHLSAGAAPWSHIFNGFYPEGHQHDPCADHICRQYKSWNLMKKENICFLIQCIYDCLVGWAQQETSALWMSWKPWPTVGALPLLKSSFLWQVLPSGTHHCRAPQSGRWEHRSRKIREGPAQQIQPGNKVHVFHSQGTSLCHDLPRAAVTGHTTPPYGVFPNAVPMFSWSWFEEASGL